MNQQSLIAEERRVLDALGFDGLGVIEEAANEFAERSFVVGQLYPVTMVECNQVLRSMGMGAMLADGVPDVTRGRRYLKGDTYSAEWEFWMSSGQRVNFSVCTGRGETHDHFIASFGRGIDPNRPEPQFPDEVNPLREMARKAVASMLSPTKCIKPECVNLVAPVGTKKVQPGVCKNYRATGACQKGHNIYQCSKCEVPHSYVSGIGKAHLEFREEIDVQTQQ